ncbi:MAG: hypothetical protein BroJett025_06620 [Patescibacteria group bacterium]|nr:MAG: hypothetical protein BroJett025_06620 [Patescibacteria group bacterium]
MIVFSSVSKQFLPDSYALENVSFDIDPGELVLLTGPSGSGKTTVMKLLTKEYQPTSGEILFHTVNLNDIKNSLVHEHRRKIGVVFQDYKLIPELNVWENIALPLSIIGKSEAETEERVTDLLELVGLADKAMYFPKQLSGGEAQRISIARALSTAPSVIFADEPTGNLDKDNSLQIAKLLTKINELGTTILFATHDHDVLDILGDHRHIVLENGKLVSDTAGKSKKVKKEETKKTDTKTEEKAPEVVETVTIVATNEPKRVGFLSSLFGKKESNKKISLKKEDEKTKEKVTETKSESEPDDKDSEHKKTEKKEEKSEKKPVKAKKKS